MYRYRLVTEDGTDLGPFVSPRLAFQPGEKIAVAPARRFVILNVVETEAQADFRAYLVVQSA